MSKSLIRDAGRLLLGTLAAAVLWHGILLGQEGNVVVLNHADSLVGREIDGERARELIGNVRMTQGSVVVTCRRAVQYLGSNRVALEGEVQVADSTMRMVGNRGMYYGNERVAEAFERVMVDDRNTSLTSDYGKYFVREKRALFIGRVTVEDTGSILNADTLFYYRTDRHSIGTGNVSIRNRSGRMKVFGDRFENDRARKYSVMTGSPRMIEIDTAGGGRPDTLTVTSMRMESYEDSLERLVATDSVRMVRSQLAAEAGSSIFFTKLDSIILREHPFVWYESDQSQDNQVSGDSIFIRLRDRKLETVFVRGTAAAISRADSHYVHRFNQMTGQEIILHFADSKLDRVDVDRTATSLYYLFDGRKPNGVNRSSGDHVTMTFVAGKIDKLKIIAGPEGQFFPEKMVRGKESQYNLAGFNWRENRPRMKGGTR